MILIHAEHAQLLLSSYERSLRIILGVLRNLDLASGNCTLVKEDFGAVELNLSKTLVVDGFEVLTDRAGDVGALHFHQELTLFYVVADAGMDINHAAGGNGDDRDRAGDVGIDRSGDLNLRSGRVAGRRH